MTDEMLKPEVIAALGPYFWLFAFLIAISLTTIVVVVSKFLSFLGNHMGRNVEAQVRVVTTLGHLCERTAAVEAKVDDCPERRNRRAEDPE